MLEKTYKVVIVDDHSIISESLGRMINLLEDMEVVAICSNGEEAIEAVKNYEVDLVLMDAIMPVMNGVEATRTIKAYKSSIKILMLTTFSDRDLIFTAFEAGVDGYLLKDTTYDRLTTSMKEVLEGSFILPSEIASKLVKQVIVAQEKKPLGFNATELEIIDLLKAGLSNKQIAGHLNISYGTTRNYISDIYHKVGSKDRDSTIRKLKEYD